MKGKGNPARGAAVLRLTLGERLERDPGAREIYLGTLRDLGVTEAQVESYIEGHRGELLAVVVAASGVKAPGSKAP